ncbi:hypothetical protein Aperf_G00000094883 [Anoplocephala perfoliata]
MKSSSSSVMFEIYENNRPWSFGIHAMLSIDDLNFLRATLECKWCYLRHNYHLLVRQELADATKCAKSATPSPSTSAVASSSLSVQPSVQHSHFHSLTRLIKAIVTPVRKEEGKRRSRRGTSYRRVCRRHAGDVLRYILYAVDDDIYHLHIRGVASSCPAKWVGEIFVKGESRLYRKLDEMRKRDADSCLPGNSDRGNLALPHSRRRVRKEIMEANRRWNEYYGGVGDMSGGRTPVHHVAKTNKRVRFPNGPALTKVFHLTANATKNGIVRRDHGWREAADERHRRQQQQLMKRPHLSTS